MSKTFLRFKEKPFTRDKKKSIVYRKFLLSSVLTLLVCFGIEPAINLFVFFTGQRRPQTEDWMFYQYRLKEKLATQTSKKKILVVAGSSAPFGISAKQIEAELGIPTINFGIHAGLGVDYLLHQAKKVLKPGDVVLLPLEFPLYHKSKHEQIATQPLKNYIISYERDYFNHLNPFEKWIVLFSGAGLTQELFDFARTATKDPSFITFDKEVIYDRLSNGSIQEDCYSEKSLNSNGDQLCNIGQSPHRNLLREKAIDPHPKEAIDASGAIKEFSEFAKQNNITVIPLYPAVLVRPNYQSEKFKKYFLSVEKFWENQGISFEDSTLNSFAEEKLMFNSSWHLNDKGRTWRTAHVIDILKNRLRKN